MQENPKKIKLYTDGGARGNPGPAGIGFVVIEVSSGAEIILEKCGNYLGHATNNQAEYQALIAGLTWLEEHGRGEPLEIFLDSALVVNQVKGEFKLKNQALIPLHAKVMRLLGKRSNYSIHHIPRAQNFLADSLVNQALDSAPHI